MSTSTTTTTMQATLTILLEGSPAMQQPKNRPRILRLEERAPSNCMRIPPELFRPIISYVQDKADLCSLAVASRITQMDAERSLHHSIKARGIAAVARACQALSRYPRIALLVRKISFKEAPDEVWPTPLLIGFRRILSQALRNVVRLTHLDASILPSFQLLLGYPFRLQSFTHKSLTLGADAIKFFAEQSTIIDLTLNPFSFYEVHEDEDHYRRLLYTILPNIQSLSCGPSAAIRLVKGRPLKRLIIPPRPDDLETDQLERMIGAVCESSHTVLRHLRVGRVFEDRDGLRCITTRLPHLRSLSIVLSYASEWLQELHTLTQLHTLSVVGDAYFDAHDPSLALDDLRGSCPALTRVFIRRSVSSVRADEWVYQNSEWICADEIDIRYLADCSEL